MAPPSPPPTPSVPLLGGRRILPTYHCVAMTTIIIVVATTTTMTTTTSAFGLGHHQRRTRTTNAAHNIVTALRSTPFDLDMYPPPPPYDDDDGDGPPPSTADERMRRRRRRRRLVLGINKYSHDASLCAADADTGAVLFASSKERHTRRKSDGGNVADLVELCLDELDADLDDVIRVVMNDHHHRVLPIEENAEKVEWEIGLGINYGGGHDGGGYGDEYNLLASVSDKFELSHHLAHAYSVASQCTYDRGMIVIMDGMGETWRTMRKACLDGDKTYVSDLTGGYEDVQFVPHDVEERAMHGIHDWREAESVYTFVRDGGCLAVKPVFKRFTEENSPPALYNHGFENMDSVGAVYSRASSHIFSDWNACGKVMGLAPWMGHVWDVGDDDGNDVVSEGTGDEKSRRKKARLTSAAIDEPILEGSLYDGTLRIDRRRMMGMPYIARVDPDMFDDDGNMVRDKRYDFDDNDYVPPPERDDGPVVDDGASEAKQRPTKQLPTRVALDAIGLAHRMQSDLETVCMDFVRHFKEQTGETKLCLAGGVALNSVLNGRLARELGFESTFVPPYPGDDGIAVGCCAYGLFGRPPSSARAPDDDDDGGTVPADAAVIAPPLWKGPVSPYLGPMPTPSSMKDAIEWGAPWLEVEIVADGNERDNLIVDELASGGVVAVYNGRSEMGPRALGHRSILADPRKKGLVRFINEFVKKRESFRPFAPSCLAEEAGRWFDLGETGGREDDNVSPYMSMTAMVKDDKRELIPAVTHVDGSSRLQTVTSSAEPRYHRLISAFYKATGVPMVLNTSFNTLKGEPIVETPRDAIRSFLSSMGTIEMLVMGDYVIKRKDADVRRLLGEEKKGGKVTPPSFPRRTGSVNYKTTFTVGIGGEDDDDGVPSENSKTLVQMPNRPMHNDKDGGWFELLDDMEGQLLGICDGTVGVNEMMTQFTAMSEEENYDKITEADQFLLENIISRLVRLYEHSLISW